MRDNFPRAVIDVVARRVGNRCSNPWCGRPTSGPSGRSEKAVNLGVAAHITAASERGPRYHISLSRAARSDFGNAIRLCQFCATLIDKDPKVYTVEVIRGWKRIAEEAARQKGAHCPAGYACLCPGMRWSSVAAPAREAEPRRQCSPRQ